MNKSYDIDLDRNAANFQPLTPLSFLARTAAVFPDRTAIVHGAQSWTYAALYARTRRLASALAKAGIGHRFFMVRGGHNWALWRGEASLALLAASSHLAHA